MEAFGGQLGRPRAKNRGPKVMRKRLQILKSRPTEPGYPRTPQKPPGYLRKAAVADPPELSLTIKTNSPQHALHHCKAVGGGSMTAGAIAATVPEKYQRKGSEKRRKMLWEGPVRGCIEAKLGCKSGLRREVGGLGGTLGSSCGRGWKKEAKSEKYGNFWGPKLEQIEVKNQ